MSILVFIFRVFLERVDRQTSCQIASYRVSLDAMILFISFFLQIVTFITDLRAKKMLRSKGQIHVLPFEVNFLPRL